MALATVRHRANYPSALEAVPNCVRVSGRFTTAGAGAPTVKSSGPWSVGAPSTGRYTITLTEPCAEILELNVNLLVAGGSSQRAVGDSANLNIGTSAVPASFIIETQSTAGTAANLTGPIVSFNIVYRKGQLTNR